MKKLLQYTFLVCKILISLIFKSFYRVGRIKHKKVIPSEKTTSLFIGKEANENRGLLRLSHPMSHGVVDD